jgi:dTDP-4-dehydrorhamnose reductase
MSASTSRLPFLIFGADGMLGSDLVLRLGGQCQAVIGPQYRVKNPGDRVIDVTAKEQVMGIVAQYNPLVVINAAAYTDVDGCETNAVYADKVNGAAVGYIAEACNAAGARLVHISTDYVFDGTKETPYLETDSPNPISKYGISKLEGELLAQKAKECLIVRTAWLYGIHGKNFITAIVKKAQDEGVLSVVDDQTGSPTCATDLVEGVLRLVDTGARGMYHLTNAGSCSWFDYAKKIVEFAGLPHVAVQAIRTEETVRPAPRPKFSVLNISKFEQATSQRMRPWQEALNDFIRTHKDRLIP